MYALLNKFEVAVSEEEQGLLTNLRPAADAFRETLKEVEGMLGRCKVNMKRDLESSITSYNDRQVSWWCRCLVCLPMAIKGNASVIWGAALCCAATALCHVMTALCRTMAGQRQVVPVVGLLANDQRHGPQNGEHNCVIQGQAHHVFYHQS